MRPDDEAARVADHVEVGGVGVVPPAEVAGRALGDAEGHDAAAVARAGPGSCAAKPCGDLGGGPGVRVDRDRCEGAGRYAVAPRGDGDPVAKNASVAHDRDGFDAFARAEDADTDSLKAGGLGCGAQLCRDDVAAGAPVARHGVARAGGVHDLERPVFGDRHHHGRCGELAEKLGLDVGSDGDAVGAQEFEVAVIAYAERQPITQHFVANGGARPAVHDDVRDRPWLDRDLGCREDGAVRCGDRGASQDLAAEVREPAVRRRTTNVCSGVSAAQVDDPVQVRTVEDDTRLGLVVCLDVDRGRIGGVANDGVRMHAITEDHAHAGACEGEERALHPHVASDGFGLDGGAVHEHGLVREEASVAGSCDDAELGARLSVVERGLHVDVNGEGLLLTLAHLDRGEVDGHEPPVRSIRDLDRDPHDVARLDVDQGRVHERRPTEVVPELARDHFEGEVGELEARVSQGDHVEVEDRSLHLARDELRRGGALARDDELRCDACVRRSVREASVGAAGVCV